MRQSGGRGEYFVFEYEANHDPTAENVRAQKDDRCAYFEFWPEIQAGVHAGQQETKRRGERLCCTALIVPAIKFTDVDTTPQLVRRLLTDFVRARLTEWAELIPPLRAEWLTSDVVALARGISANAALDGLPALCDALLEAGCDDPLVIEHLQTCPDHSPSCWVVEMILDQLKM